MFALYFLLPILAVLILEIKEIRAGTAWKHLRIWLELLAGILAVVGMQMFLFMDFGAFLSFSLLGLLAAAITSAFYALLLFFIRYIKRTKSVLVTLLLALTVAIFLEGTVFNFRFYQTHDYQELDLTDGCYISGNFVPTGNREREYKVQGSSPYIELRNINTKVSNIYVGIVARNQYDKVVNAYVEVHMKDESNVNYLKLPAQTVMAEVESTKFLNLVTNGASEDIKMVVTTNYAKTFQIESIRINVPQSFNFSFVRMLTVALLLFLFRILRPSSKLWSYSFSDSAAQRTVTVAVVILEILALTVIAMLNPAFLGNPARHTAQYQELAEAFLDGRLYLEEVPPEYLAEMENPYDYSEREKLEALYHESYYWDAAYYEGHYYVYFGVVPVLLTYLPYRLITGEALPNVAALLVFMTAFVIGSFLLIAKIIKKYFAQKRIPYLSYLILCLIFVNASGAVFIAKRPDFYSVPILAALAFTVFGVYFWIKSDRGSDGVHPLYIGLGSLCMALVAGCRPQLLVVSGMIFVIYWNAVFKERTLFSKRGWVSTLSAIVPYLLVAAGIFWYNYARFGSLFDFGANYNLTTNDMTGRGFRVERLGLAVFTYFFQPPNITASFPFLNSTSIQTNYLGRTITEPMFGGIFMVIPLLWVLFLLPRYGGKMKKRGLLAFCVVPVILSLFLGMFDAQGAGILQRYVSDFAFLSCLAAIFMVLFLYEGMRGTVARRLHGFLRFALGFSGVYCFLCIFAKYGTEIFYKNPYLFNRVAELIQFW